MKTILLSALVLASVLVVSAPAARADQVVSAKLAHNSTSFVMDSVIMSGDILYSCDALESQVSDMLTKMGALNVQVDCMGNGDPDSVSFDPTVSVSFDSIQVAHGDGTMTAAYGAVELRDTQGCFVSQQLFANLHSYFDIENAQGFTACVSDQDGYDYTFSTLFAH